MQNASATKPPAPQDRRQRTKGRDMLARRYGVDIERVTHGPRAIHHWRAYIGSNGTAEPEIEIATSYTLRNLARRLAFAKKESM